jgi:hypothetical protein
MITYSSSRWFLEWMERSGLELTLCVRHEQLCKLDQIVLTCMGWQNKKMNRVGSWAGKAEANKHMGALVSYPLLQ